MKKIICLFIGHKIPKWKKNPKESMFVSINCLRCGADRTEANFYYPWEKEYKLPQEREKNK